MSRTSAGLEPGLRGATELTHNVRGVCAATPASPWTDPSGGPPSGACAAPGTGWSVSVADPTAASSGPSPSRLGTVRWRTTLGAVAVVGVALAVASIALVVLLRSTLTNAVEAVGRVQATEVAAQLVASGPGTSLDVLDAEEQLIQVLGPTGLVVASSSNVAGMAPVADLAAGGSTVTHLDLDDGADFVVVAETAEVDDGSVLVLVGRSLEEVAESTGAVTRLVVSERRCCSPWWR